MSTKKLMEANIFFFCSFSLIWMGNIVQFSISAASVKLDSLSTVKESDKTSHSYTMLLPFPPETKCKESVSFWLWSGAGHQKPGVQGKG